tara:strand:+ start:779 stop:1006 length:228 start_codon:yes stop_codon:yes gene_type:complete
MNNITQHKGTLTLIGRVKNSYVGNPQFMLNCDGCNFRTQANSMIVYCINNYLDKEVTVTLGTHRGCLTLDTIKGV